MGLVSPTNKKYLTSAGKRTTTSLVCSHMNNLLSFTLVLILVGCTTIKNVSDSKAFTGIIGIKHLIKDAFICKVDDKAMFERDLPDNELYENHGFKSCPYGKDVASLQKGAKIRISEISYRSHFGFVSYTDHWYLIGSTEVESKTVDLYFYLGITTDGKPPVDYKGKLLWN